MNSIDEGLAILETILKPNYLSAVQELVFRQCWQEMSYEEIAEISGYDADYLRTVGSRLWQSLSDIMGERITKKNFRAVLRQRVIDPQTSDAESPSTTVLPALEFPDGPVPIESPFYIERPPIDQRALEMVLQPGALIRFKAPQRMGKTSLLMRTLTYAQSRGCRVARLNFRQADSTVLRDLERFLRWFCLNLARQLNLAPQLDDYWDSDLGSKVSCTAYLQDYLLAVDSHPLVIALDEVNYIFEYPEIAREFLPLLRFWHEESNNLAIWQQFHLVIAHATDSYVPLNINQSPFNVGIALQVPEFEASQVLELACRHGLRWQEDSVNALMEMIGGHPYLVRLALYYIVREGIELEQFLSKAPTQEGIYSDHLQSYLVSLREHPELEAAFKQVILSNTPLQIDTLAAYKLYQMGLVKLHNDQVMPRCKLHRLYFRDRLTS